MENHKTLESGVDTTNMIQNKIKLQRYNVGLKEFQDAMLAGFYSGEGKHNSFWGACL